MRMICGIFAVILILFAVTQWNDPDAAFWAAVYGVGALWCGIAALAPRAVARRAARATLLLTLGAAVLGVVAFWPEARHWWSLDVWWPERSGETAREGMGMMVLAAAVASAALVGLRRA